MDSIWHKVLRRPYQLHTEQVGNGKETVVLLHGLASSTTAWNPLIKQLDLEYYRVINIDLLGFGQSPKPQWKEYTVDDHTEAVLATLKKARIKQANIIAHSMGCLVASHIAITTPALVKQLLLYEPPLFADDPGKRIHRWRQGRYYALFEYISTHPELLMLQSKRIWRLAQQVSGLMMTTDMWLPFERSLRNTIMRQKAFTELHNLTVPTDIIHGRLDFIVMRAAAQQQLKDNKHIQLHLVGEFHGITTRAGRYLSRLLDKKTGNRPAALPRIQELPPLI